VYSTASRLKLGICGLPITEPNSLFSNMIMAMCPKFGTRGRGVAVGVCEGVARAVGERVTVGAGVNVGVAEGTGDATLGGAEVVQAEIKTNRKIQKPSRFIRAFLKK
jgi:hypothetical protein